MWFLLTGAPPPMGAEGPLAAPPADAKVAANKATVIPEGIRRLLATMLAVNPDARPHDALAFYLQLQKCLTEIGPRPPTSRSPGKPPASRTRAAETPAKRLPVKAIALGGLLIRWASSPHYSCRDTFDTVARSKQRHQAERPKASLILLPRRTRASTAGPVVVLAPPKPAPQQPSPASAANVISTTITSSLCLKNRTPRRLRRAPTTSPALAGPSPGTIEKTGFKRNGSCANGGAEGPHQCGIASSRRTQTLDNAF